MHIKLNVGGTEVNKKFKSPASFDKYLDSKGYTGLLPDGGIPEEDEVQDWDDLQDGGTYAPVGRELLEEKVKTIRREL